MITHVNNPSGILPVKFPFFQVTQQKIVKSNIFNLGQIEAINTANLKVKEGEWAVLSVGGVLLLKKIWLFFLNPLRRKIHK